METQAIRADVDSPKALAAASTLRAMECLATITSCEDGDTIYRCKDPVHYWYRIVAGAGRGCALSRDGRRQIVDFLLPGDFFGFAAQDSHGLSAEVIAPQTRVARYPRYLVEKLAETDPQVSRRIREIAFVSITRLQTRMVILGQTSALDKVGAFLLEMADRCPGPANAIVLPMSRYDIADYLAMAVETVSRALTELKARGVITLEGVRWVYIRDRCALEQRAAASWVN